MTLRASKDVAFFVFSGRDLLSALTQFSDKHDAPVEEVAVLGDTWAQRQFTGVKTAEITQSGFFDDSVGGMHAALKGNQGTTGVVCYGLEGTATGARFVGWQGAVVQSYQVQVALGAIHKAEAVYKTAGAVEEGKLLRTWKLAGTTGQSTPIDAGASSTGGAAYIQFSAPNNAEGHFRVMHSSDNITYAELVLVDQTASGSFGYRVTTTGTIERYTAMDYTTASATGNAAITSYVGGIVRY